MLFFFDVSHTHAHSHARSSAACRVRHMPLHHAPLTPPLCRGRGERTGVLQGDAGLRVQRPKGEERQEQHERVQGVVHQQPVRAQPLHRRTRTRSGERPSPTPVRRAAALYALRLWTCSASGVEPPGAAVGGAPRVRWSGLGLGLGLGLGSARKRYNFTNSLM